MNRLSEGAGRLLLEIVCSGASVMGSCHTCSLAPRFTITKTTRGLPKRFESEVATRVATSGGGAFTS
jgi:hypothetical protein